MKTRRTLIHFWENSMPFDAQQLFDAALHLPEDQRYELVARLLEATPEELPGLSLDDEDLIAELDRRAADREGAVDWQVLRDED
jgi:hypothetical protein